MVLSGLSPDERLVEIIELPGHPWFVAGQFHPEFRSRAVTGHPLFISFVEAAVKHYQKHKVLEEGNGFATEEKSKKSSSHEAVGSVSNN